MPPNRADAFRYAAGFVARVRTLAADHHDDEIVALMTAEGRKKPYGKGLTVDMIRWIRSKHRIPAPTAPAGALTVGQVGARYGVSWGVVYYWIQCGGVRAQNRKRATPYAITIDDDTDQRLHACVKVLEVCLQALLVLRPCHPIDAWRGGLLQSEEPRSQNIDADMMQEWSAAVFYSWLQLLVLEALRM